MNTTITNPRRADADTVVIDDFATFYFGGGYTWWHAVDATDAGTLTVTVDDPYSDRPRTAQLTAAALHEAFESAHASGRRFCCLEAIRSDSYGAGCADDVDTILQTALFGEPVYS